MNNTYSMNALRLRSLALKVLAESYTTKDKTLSCILTTKYRMLMKQVSALQHAEYRIQRS